MWAGAAKDGSRSEGWRPTLKGCLNFIHRKNVVSLMGPCWKGWFLIFGGQYDPDTGTAAQLMS